MIVRAYQLRKGDRFIKQGITYKVLKVTDTSVCYISINNSGYAGQTLGIKSKERVELINSQATSRP